MTNPRAYHNMVLLPDGTVLALAGDTHLARNESRVRGARA